MDLHINNNWKRIGIRLSGGADSSIIYYAIRKHFKDTDTQVIPLTMNSTQNWWYSTVAKAVMDRVDELLGTTTTDHYIFNDDQPHGSERYIDAVNILSESAIIDLNLDAIYIGLTQNPQGMSEYFDNPEIIKRHALDWEDVRDNINSRDQTRDLGEIADLEVLGLVRGNKSVLQVIPFANLDKLAVSQVYRDLNMIDALYPVTFSCENSDINLRGQPLRHCKHCFFCLERLYAFDRII